MDDEVFDDFVIECFEEIYKILFFWIKIIMI